MSIEADLKGIREAVLWRCDWSNAPSGAMAKVDAFINEAIAQVSLEAPFLFHESLVRFKTEPDLTGYDDTDTLVAATDTGNSPQLTSTVLIKELPIGVTQTDLPYDRSLDGRWIDLVGPDGTTHTNQIRSVWVEENYLGLGDDYYAISLVRPLYLFETGNDWVDGGITWRIYTPTYYLPDNVVQVNSLRVVGSTMPAKISIISQDQAEQNALLDLNGENAGAIPLYAYRRPHFQFPGPNTAPSAALAGTWIGPEPPGQFEYVYTYTWGKRHFDYQNEQIPTYNYDGHTFTEDNNTSPTSAPNAYGFNRMREPRFESAPSPVSDAITVPAVSGSLPLSSSSAVTLTFPNIEYESGFYMTGTHNSAAFTRIGTHHSGVHIRIYRRRKSANFTNYSVMGTSATGTSMTGLAKLDIQDAFYLLAEYKVTSGQLTFVDDGRFIPDRSRRLRNVHGYQGLGLYPLPDADYDIEARCIMRPPVLISDSDVPAFHPEAIKLVVDYSMSLVYELLKDPIQREASLQAYRLSLQSVVKRFSDLRPPHQPARREPARSRRYNRFVPWWRSS